MSYKFQPNSDQPDRIEEYPTLISLLASQRVVDVKQHEEGFSVEEKCDGWFSVVLTPDELESLGHELIALAKTHPNPRIRANGVIEGVDY